MPSYRIPQLNMPLEHDRGDIGKRIRTTLGLSAGTGLAWRIERESVDARDRDDIRIIYCIVAESAAVARSKGRRRFEILPGSDAAGDARERVRTVSVPAAASDPRTERSAAHRPEPFGNEGRPVVAGAGPAGLFCALALAEAGHAPILVERGDDVDGRMKKVHSFWAGGDLDPESNMQFGEGGAGTFSDGKLSTTVGDREGLAAQVTKILLEAGAPGEIAWNYRPHIGTDLLVGVVRNLRGRIQAAGGRVMFGLRVDDLVLEEGRIAGIVLGGGETYATRTLVLATGHSARDTYGMLDTRRVPIVPKAFAIGLRIEHPQETIQRAQYGRFHAHPRLRAADYRLAWRSASGRGVYSFCMCPGGYVVNASSEPGMVACNGMSDFARDARNANSAIVVTVGTEDFGSPGALAGIEFQRRWERAAYLAANPSAEPRNGAPGPGGGARPVAGIGGAPATGAGSGHIFAMPVQRLADFRAGNPSAGFGGVTPCAKGAVRMADLNLCLPAFAAASIKEGIACFGSRIDGFDDPDAVLTGVETRTSAPVRILRDDTLQSAVRGLYPCGEGAGYAGGIMSAAMDGLRVAAAIMGRAPGNVRTR